MYDKLDGDDRKCCSGTGDTVKYTDDKVMIKPSYKKCIKVPEVIGRNACQVLLEEIVAFPHQYPALELKDIHKTVTDLIVHVCKNKVLVNGVLHKNVNYKTFEGEYKTDCVCDKKQALFGSVRHIGFDIPFACYIEVPGACPGDRYQIEFAGVENECEIDILEDPVCNPLYPVKLYRKLREKVIVKVDLKVLRDVQITVRPDDYNICP